MNENGLARKSSAPESSARALLLGAGPRGEHEDRGPVAGLATTRAEDVPRQPGEHHVDDERVVAVLGGVPLAIRAGERHVDGVSLRLEAAAQTGSELLVVLDHQDPHGLTFAPAA